MKKEIPILATLVGLTALSGTMLSQVPKNAAAEIVDDISVTINASCTLAATGTTHSATIQPGNTVENIGNTSITVTCNDANGWGVYAVGYGGDTKGNTNLSTVISGTTYNIPTGTSGDSSYWAMKLAAVSPTPANTILSAYQSYHAVPSDYDKVASMDSISSNAPTFSTTYKAHASSGQAAGTYNGKVKYILVHPNTAIACDNGYGYDGTTCVQLKQTAVNFTGGNINSITFLDTHNFEIQTVSTTGSSVSLIPGVSYEVTANNLASGYKATFTATKGTVAPATDHSVTYTPASEASEMTIAASRIIVCNPDGAGINEILCMQDISTSNKSSILGSMVEDQSYQLTDSRDGKTYWVAKLKDDNIWMTQNLDLGGTEAISLDSTNTDLTDGNTFTLPASGSWSSTYSEPKIYDPGDNYFVTSGSTSDDTKYTSLSACTTAGNSEEVCTHGHNGNYYNWYALTAGSNASAMRGGQEAPQSICPKGWRLPKGTGSTDNQSWYYMLKSSIADYGNNAATSQAMRTAPLYIPRAGYYNTGGSLSNVSSNGNYWSSTAYGDSDARYLSFNSSNVRPQTNSFASNGFSARCLVR